MKKSTRVDPKEFEAHVVLVTGAGAGIGETVAERLFAGGASVVLLGRHLDSVEAVCRRLDPDGKRTWAVEADVRNPAAVEKAILTAVQKFGKLDLAVNNAAITGPAGVPIQELDPSIWKDVIETDLGGVFHCMKFEIPAMLACGGGAIVNMSSANGLVGLAGMAAYTTAKHGEVARAAQVSAVARAGAGGRSS